MMLTTAVLWTTLVERLMYLLLSHRAAMALIADMQCAVLQDAAMQGKQAKHR